MSDSPSLSTGFGRITREVLSRIVANEEVEVGCIAWGVEQSAEAEIFPGLRIYPSAAGSFGRDVISDAVRDFKPDILVTLAEIRVIEWLALHPIRHQVVWIGYIPLDGGPFYPPWLKTLSQMQHIVTMSEFGRGVIESGFASNNVQVIYHGIESATFCPLLNRAEIKRHPRFEGRFVVGCVARNQARKNQPALITAFAKLAKKYQDLHLYLHCMPSAEGYDLVELLKRFELQGRADLSSPRLSVKHGITDAQLNELYNLFDLMVLPTCGEGFGLPILESMSAGVPVVATDCSSCRELVWSRGELARVRGVQISIGNILEQSFVDTDSLAECIERIYLSAALREKYSRAGREFAQSLDWRLIVPKWVKLLSRASGIQLTWNDRQADNTSSLRNRVPSATP